MAQSSTFTGDWSKTTGFSAFLVATADDINFFLVEQPGVSSLDPTSLSDHKENPG